RRDRIGRQHRNGGRGVTPGAAPILSDPPQTAVGRDLSDPPQTGGDQLLSDPPRILVTVEHASDDWTPFVRSRASTHFAWEWRDVFARVFGHGSFYLAAKVDGRVQGVLPLVFIRSWLFGRALVSLPFLNYGGVIADDDRVAAALAAHARLLGE